MLRLLAAGRKFVSYDRDSHRLGGFLPCLLACLFVCCCWYTRWVASQTTSTGMGMANRMVQLFIHSLFTTIVYLLERQSLL